MQRCFGKPRFAAMRYGYGAGLPIAWQGWAATAVFIGLEVAAAARLRGAPRPLACAGLMAGFVALTALKTEGGWRWRWGSEDR